MGRQRDSAESLREAVEHARQALTFLECDTTPMAWAEAKETLGRALTRLAEHGADEREIAAGTEALHAAKQIYQSRLAPDHPRLQLKHSLPP